MPANPGSRITMNQNPPFDDGWARPLRPLATTPPPLARGWSVDGIRLALGCAFVFLAPFNLLRLDAFYFTLSDAFAAVLLFVMLLGRGFEVAPLKAATVFWNSGIALFSVMMLTSSLLFGDPERGFIVVGQYLFAYWLLGHIVLGRPSGEVATFAKIYVVAMWIICVQGIYVIHVLQTTGTTFVSGNGRFLGFVERENECAAVIAMAVPLLFWLTETGRVGRLWLVLGLPLLAYGIVLTGSNTGLIMLSYSIGAFVLIGCSMKQMVMIGAILAGIVNVVLTWGRDFLPDVFQRRVLGALETGDIDSAGTFVGRMQLVHAAVNMAERSMIFGAGADQFRTLGTLNAPVHNTYLLIWNEAGFPGLIGFCLMLLAPILVGISAFGKGGDRLAGTCTLVMTGSFILMLNTLPHVYGRFMVVPLLLGIAPSIAALRRAPAKGTVRPRAGRRRG
jgi:O-antigen ligase